MRSNKFFTLTQLEEIDKLGRTAYVYIFPGVTEKIENINHDIEIESADEVDEADIISVE